jgi:hypothetical protein
VLTFLRFFGPGLGAIGMVVNQRGAAFAAGRQNARFLPWRRDAKAEWRATRASRREPEIGELGISQPFTTNRVLAIERRLGIVDDVTTTRAMASESAAAPYARPDTEGVSVGAARG